MARYLAARLVGLIAVLLAVSVIVFALQSVVPADPARALAGPAAPQETVERLREEMGLNDPVATQYVRFLARLAQGDLGTSVRTRQGVAADVVSYLPASLELIAAALFLGVAMALALALAQGSRAAGALRLAMIAGGSVPIFLSALLLVYVFWFRLDWLPGAGRIGIRRFEGPTGFMLIDAALSDRPGALRSALAHLVLPATALALPVAVAVGRSLRGALVDVLAQPYIRTARGNGLGESRVLLAHGLRNAATPPLSMLGLQLGLLFANLLIVERIFAWPGLGLYMVQSFAASDLPAVLGVSLVFGALYIAVNVAIEILQSLADPRIAL